MWQQQGIHDIPSQMYVYHAICQETFILNYPLTSYLYFTSFVEDTNSPIYQKGKKYLFTQKFPRTTKGSGSFKRVSCSSKTCVAF